MSGRPKKPTGPQATAPEGTPEKPEGLSTVASQEWDELIAALTELGVISACDRAAIEMAARYAGFFHEAAEDVRVNGLTVVTKTGAKANPSIRARDDAARIRKAYLEALGLTPASRSRVSSASTDSDEPSLEDILDGDGTKGSAARAKESEGTEAKAE
ncbi:MAG: phage terminase small subunit P27 family [Terriglobales bacterium]